jgi:alpha-galactosidase
LWYEDCVNGGRLIDYGVAKRTHYYSVSDVNDAIVLRQVFYDASYPMPPSMLELYLDHNSDANRLLMRTEKGFVYALRSCLLGWPTIQCDTTTWDAAKRNAAMREFGFFKTKLRPLIANGNIYHVLPRPSFAKDPNLDPNSADDPGWDGIEYYDPATGKGALMVFRPYSAVSHKTIKLKGLTPAKSYTVESADGGAPTQTLSGAVLMSTGIAVTIPVQNASDIVFLTEAD